MYSFTFLPLIDISYRAMTPCVLCTNEFEKLQQKRSDELERVMIEHLQDGYEEPLAENLHDEVLKETIAEAKRQNKSVLQQKRKTTIHNSRLRRVNLLTRAHFAFASSWMKKEPSSPSSVQSLSQSVQNEIPAEEVETPIGNLETPKTFNELTFHPKLQSDYSSDSDFSGSINSTSRRSTSALLAAKLMRKISASPSKSGIIFKSYSPYDPILAIRPLSEIPYCCILHSGWFHSWKRYIQSGLFEDIEYPVLHPGPITNHLLLKKSFRRGSILENKIKSSNIPPLQRDSSYARLNMKGNHLSSTSNTSTSASASMESNTIIISSGITILNDYLKKDLNLHHDYIVVSPNVWKVLHGIYGGGPPIFREDINIYSQEYNFEGKPLFSVGTTSSIVQGQPQPQPPINL